MTQLFNDITYLLLCICGLIQAFEIRSLKRKLEDTQHVIGHMLLGNITGARELEDGDIEITGNLGEGE